jgi:hypothetical protein
MHRMLRSVLLKSLLVFALLFAQQGVVTHSISHILTEKSQDQSLPHTKHCSLCAAYAQIGSAISVSHVSFDFAASFEEVHTSYFTSFHSTPFTAFAARAPPYSA